MVHVQSLLILKILKREVVNNVLKQAMLLILKIHFSESSLLINGKTINKIKIIKQQREKKSQSTAHLTILRFPLFPPCTQKIL